MGRIWAATCFLWFVTFSGGQEFRRMPDHRGQSFGLENFLLQPFNLAAQAEEATTPPRRRDRIRHRDSYPTEYQVQGGDFDMKKLVPTGPRGPLAFRNEELSSYMTPVHEFVDQPMAPPKIRQTQSEGFPGRNDRRRISTAETRRPLERPSEFQLTSVEGDQLLPPPQVPTERHRKRVMKRRRKKPTTPQPESPEEVEDETPTLPSKSDTVDEIELNIFTDNAEPEVHKTSFFIQHNKEPEEEVEEAENEVRQTRRKQNRRKHQKPALEKENFTENIERYKENDNEEDKVIGEATVEIPLKELPFEPTTTKHEELSMEIVPPTTETPQEPTHRLKTLLKQQNGQLSLSELLQTQNLSLADFLKGNPGALSALGANKVNVEETTTSTTSEPETEKPKFQPSRTHVPKISPKSRPFSKPNFNNTKPIRRTTTEDPVADLPKKLDIIEITSDRPTYNGFTPKNPRTRPPYYPKNNHRVSISKEKFDEDSTEALTNLIKPVTESDEEVKEDDKDEPVRTTQRTPVYRLTTVGPIRESTIGEQRVVPKRYGDYRSKLRVDRRKTTTESTTDSIPNTEQQETSRIPSTTEEVKLSSESRNRVRIPFMSVNNPEISVILPNKKNSTTTTEKPRYNSRERVNLFKRVSPEDKSPLSDVTLDTKPAETTIAMTIPTTTTTTTTTTTKTTTSTQASTTAAPTKTTESKTFRTTTEIAKTTAMELEKELEIEKKETSDEITELLKTGSNAQRLERILATRNMTLNELLEKRARSSKHPNVTRLFENQTDSQLSNKEKIPELTDNYHPTTEKITPPLSTVKPALVLPEFPIIKSDHIGKPKVAKPVTSHHHDSNSFDELYVDESVIRPIKIPVDKDEQREPKAYDNKPNKGGHRMHLNLAPGTEGKANHPMPLWNVDEKSIYNRSPYGYPTYDLNKNLAGHSQEPNIKQEPQVEETIIVETVQSNPDMNQNLKNNINEILKEQIEVVREVHGEEKTFIPPAVKSAIIASGVVMGIALVVFVAIFAACGWKQRQFRLRARSSILNDSINGSGRKVIKRTGTLSPISFKRTALYKKSLEFEDSESSISGSSNTSSYLWNTLKHTFQSRNSTLKNRQEKEEKIQERENRSRRNTLTREDERDRSRRNTLSQEDNHRDSMFLTREQELPRRNTLTKDDFRRDSMMSNRREFSREDARRSSGYRDDTRRLNTLMRDSEQSSFKKIDPERNIIQTSVNFKRGGFNGSSRHFDSCDHFN